MLEYKWYCEGEPSSCTESICGDHRVTAGEECDDRWSPANGDGCTANCIIEAGWTCKAQNDTGTSVCAEQCGDGIVTVHEQCDDANSAPGDGCYHCAFETGWYCEGSPSVCENVVCGDGDVSPIEGCDDNNTVSHDGCTACTVDLGYKCTGSPSVCSWITCDLKQTGLTVNNCSCNSVPDGSVIIVATGGTGNLSYAVRRASSVFDPSKLNFTSNNRIAPLQAGDYVALVKDASNCYINGSSFTVVEPPGIIVVYQKCVNVTCYSYADGAVDYYAYRDNSTTEEQLQLRYAITGSHASHTTQHLRVCHTLRHTITTHAHYSPTPNATHQQAAPTSRSCLTRTGMASPLARTWSSFRTANASTEQRHVACGSQPR
eukprot:TRINITY_DN315_c0_g2_i3.p1 TRINITY_DN315_c0_g2~~TRINITY_DN315_c0_g2_i3.p1  ORF type:complete len:374 (-),score=39.15 TRINITY_DN315_c0_g2_i3:643-1764(-)